MNNLRTIITLALIGLSTCLSSQSSYILPSGKKSIFINEVNRVTIIGTTESVAKIEIEGSQLAHPERAKGLRLVNGSGYDDNTDIGLSIVEEDDQMVIREVSNRSRRRYTIYVPSDYEVSYHITSNRGGGLIIEDVKAELDVSTLHNSITMTGVSGPMAIHSVHGRIEATFDKVNQTGPISIYSVHGHLDVSIPSQTKADVSMFSGHGEIYSDVDLKIDRKEGGQNLINISDVKATINGGGVKFSLKTQHSDIYLRNI